MIGFLLGLRLFVSENSWPRSWIPLSERWLFESLPGIRARGGPYIEVQPSDNEIGTECGGLFRDPVRDRLEERAMSANAALQATAG